MGDKNKKMHRNKTLVGGKTNWSAIQGVQRLELSKIHLFHTIRRQLHHVLTAEFGEHADFIIGNVDREMDKPNLAALRREFPDLEADEVRDIYLKLAEKHALKKEKIRENNQKMFGKILLICDEPLLMR